MADYLVQADLTGRFDNDEDISFYTGTEDTGVPSTTVLAEVMASAEGAVNLRLAVRYETPVSSSDATTTAAVKRLALDFAEMYLRLRKRTLTAAKQAQFTLAKEELDEIASGKIVLPGAAVPTSTTSKRPAQFTDSTRELASTTGRLFTRGTAGGL